MIYGYVRVSTKDQNIDRQVNSLINYGVPVENIKFDKQSGKDFNRENYQRLRNEILRPGDTLVVKELDRLGRNKELLKEELDYFKKKGVRVKILNIPTTLMDIPTGQEWLIDMINNIIIEVLGAVAEEERKKIKTRQSEGIAAAKEKGIRFGRPRATFPPLWAEIYPKYKNKEISGVEAMKILNLKKTTFYKLVKEYERNSCIN